MRGFARISKHIIGLVLSGSYHDDICFNTTEPISALLIEYCEKSDLKSLFDFTCDVPTLKTFDWYWGFNTGIYHPIDNIDKVNFLLNLNFLPFLTEPGDSTNAFPFRVKSITLQIDI